MKKVLIVNRGEIAVRILRACRELGIPGVALFEIGDQSSLHVRLADEAKLLNSPAGFLDQQGILDIARQVGADAIHAGYGFLAEDAGFLYDCEKAGITFIGPPAQVVNVIRHKIETMEKVYQAGFPVVEHSPVSFGDNDLDLIRAEAERMGYPVVIKSCRGGRGRGERLVHGPERLDHAVRVSQTEAQAVYGDRRIYLEKAIPSAHQVGVQILGDRFGNLIHLGEREGSLIHGNQKIIQESPAPCLNDEQRARLWETALFLGRLFDFQNLGAVEFLVDEQGQFYFTEFKARIQMDHPLTEMVTGVDLVSEQIRIAAGEPLSLHQSEVQLRGWAIQCRVTAEDPLRNYLPSPGKVHKVRLPGGPHVRVDTYLYSGCEVPAAYDALIAKLIVWGRDRPECLGRLRAAIDEFLVVGPSTNLPLLKSILREPAFNRGEYDTSYQLQTVGCSPFTDQSERDLAVIAALFYLRQHRLFDPVIPERLTTGWHQDSRRLPE